MEEKERYVIRYDLDYNQCLIDTEENQGVGDYIQIVKLLNQQSKQIKELEKQLAEKERQLKLAEELLIKQEKEYDEQLEKQAKIHYKHLKEKDQDKISFAVEQLEKVKEDIKKVPITDYDLSRNFEKMYKQDAIRQIDNQIASLKKEMK